jgi:hypothetical protein
MQREVIFCLKVKKVVARFVKGLGVPSGHKKIKNLN